MRDKEEIEKILNKLLDPSVFEARISGDNCFLREEDPNGNYKIKIKGLPETSSVIRCDKFPQTNHFFNSTHGICKMADYAIIDEKKKLLIIIELKKSPSTSSGSSITKQLQGATCLLQYLSILATVFLDEKDIFQGYEYRYFRIMPGAKKSKFGRSQQNRKKDTPEQPVSLQKNEVHFRELST